MQTVDVEILDPSQLCGGTHPFEGRLNQIGRGALDGRAIGFLGDRIDVWIYSMGQPLQVHSAQLPGRLVLTTPLGLPRPALHNGREIVDRDVIEFSPGLENSEIYPEGIYLDLQIDRDWARERGWERGGETVRKLTSRDYGWIRGWCQERLSAPPSEESTPAPSGDKHFVARLIGLLDSPKMPLSEGPTASSGHHRVVRRALELVEGSLEEQDLSVPWLADSVGVAERTLYQAFTDEVGTSPYNYILVRRLNRLRRLLLRGPHRHGLVRDAAVQAGFDHLGRMGQMYKRQFGETPRQTLRRHAQA